MRTEIVKQAVEELETNETFSYLWAYKYKYVRLGKHLEAAVDGADLIKDFGSLAYINTLSEMTDGYDTDNIEKALNYCVDNTRI